MAYANSPPTNRHGRVAKDHYTINYISPVSYKMKFRNKGFYNTAQNDPANATGVSQKSLASLASKNSTTERDDQDRSRNVVQQNMTAQPNVQQAFADDLNDEDEILKGTPNNQRISKMSRTSPAEPADKDKQMSIQEHIDAYYAGLEQLDLKMKKKREEMRMRAFDSAEFDQGGAQQKKIAKLMAEIDAKNQREYELWKNQGVNKEGEAMLTAMRDERLHTDRELKKQSENEKSNSFLPSLHDKNGKIDVMRFRPSAQALITMAPAEKEDLFLKLKFIQKKAAQ